ncbi:PAS domain S-box protein [Aridibaculum aurantiacum]|uniref:PAS domain S-box protein n=1 Tax=Aridibaculum aurantiacum TaxID=2810307 RepID=UPI001A974633|nr:PAS domain S-box protein [Aridibaculum aurantiacum]
MLQQAINILVIEDNPGDYVLVKEYLEECFSNASIIHATSINSATPILQEKQVDVVLLDLTLPDGMGIESFHSIHNIAPLVPIIILTGIGDREIALESVKYGAQDYIVKDDSSPTVLQKSIQYGIERSKVLDHLKKSEEQYKYLFQNNPLPMWAFDKQEGNFIMVNGAAQKHYGYSEEEFLKMSIHDIEVFEDAEHAVSNSFLKRSSLTKNYASDLKHLKKNGETIDVEMQTHSIVLEGTKAYLAVLHDVTERNRAKEQLRQSEQMFRTISENFPNGAVAILDCDLKVHYIAGKEFPVPGEDALYFKNKVYTTHFTHPTRQDLEAQLLDVFNGNSVVFEASNDLHSYMISAVPLKEIDGTINRILIASQNITAQKRNEVEKEMLIEELTQNNSDLRQFSYITSHNLRAPLSNLLGIIKLLDTSEVQDPMTSLLLKNFEECTLQLNDTVNDLINVLIIKNNVNAKKERLDISKIFDRVINSIQTTLEAGEMKVHANFEEVTEVDFNRTYLESILLNLLTNAVKYKSPKRKPEVHAYTKRMADGSVKLYFSDNGLGIDLNRYKDRIFGLYQRFHDHADSKGLGLYIVNSQIRVMGGEIDIESEVDKGTTFIITFKQENVYDQ